LFSLDFPNYYKKSDKYLISNQEEILIQFLNYHMGIYL
jgi:hypothetical protein